MYCIRNLKSPKIVAQNIGTAPDLNGVPSLCGGCVPVLSQHGRYAELLFFHVYDLNSCSLWMSARTFIDYVNR